MQGDEGKKSSKSGSTVLKHQKYFDKVMRTGVNFHTVSTNQVIKILSLTHNKEVSRAVFLLGSLRIKLTLDLLSLYKLRCCCYLAIKPNSSHLFLYFLSKFLVIVNLTQQVFVPTSPKIVFEHITQEILAYLQQHFCLICILNASLSIVQQSPMKHVELNFFLSVVQTIIV